jgi:hypothetical protein
MGEVMRRSRAALLRYAGAVALGLTLSVGAIAQSGAQEQAPKQPPGQAGQPSPQDLAREQRRADEFVEAAQAINGPAGNPECVWLGRRVVVLMWRDDLDTAFRHLDLYDRFGCPGGHVQATFRCLVRSGPLDPKAPDSLSGRVHACWINPSAQPQAATAPAQPQQQPPAATPASPPPAEQNK